MKLPNQGGVGRESSHLLALYLQAINLFGKRNTRMVLESGFRGNYKNVTQPEPQRTMKSESQNQKT